MGVAEVIVAQPRGFCAGVVRAVKIVELALEKYGAPVYVKHAVVHNDHVVRRLEAQGAVTVDTVSEVPDGAVCVFSAHGSRPEEFGLAKSKDLRLIDGTCPLVTRVHNEVKKYAAEGRSIIVVGHEGHVEAIGTAAQAMAAGVRVALIEPDQEVDPTLAKTLHDKPVAVVTQTTLSQHDMGPVIGRIKAVFPEAAVRNDVCYATSNRQEAVAKLAVRRCDAILVVGSEQSSNCKRLVEVARYWGIKAVLIDGPDDPALAEWMRWPLFGAQRIGLTSGASTPDDLVDAVIQKLKPEKVTWLDGPSEDFAFKLPEEVQDATGAANS